MAQTERPVQLELLARQELPAQLVQPRTETGGTATLVKVFKRSLASQPAPATLPTVLTRLMATQAVTTTRPLVPTRSFSTRPAAATRPLVLEHSTTTPAITIRPLVF